MHRRETAAKKIQKQVRLRLKVLRNLKNTIVDQLVSQSCTTDPIDVDDENLSVYLKTNGDFVVPLFNIFRYRNELGNTFFADLHRMMMLYQGGDANGINFLFRKNDSGKVELIWNFKHIQKQLPETREEYKNFVINHCVPYVLYLLANNKVPVTEKYKLMSIKTANFLDSFGIHRDGVHTLCLTYIHSQCSTELAFDVKKKELSFIECSPLFRFRTEDDIYTLCINDTLMVHSPPLYPYTKKGIFRSLHADGYEYMTRDPDRKYRERKELDYEELFPKFADEDLPQEYMLPKSRRELPIPKVRKAVVSFVSDSHWELSLWEKNVYMTFEFDESDINKYIAKSEETFELSQELITSILQDPTVGKLKLTGGGSVSASSRRDRKHDGRRHCKSRKRSRKA